MSITKKFEQTLNGKDVFLFTLTGKNGLVAEIYNYGGIIRSLKTGGRDVVLGRETFSDYLKNNGYLGAAIGRYSNRLKDSVFTLNGTEYKVGTNDGVNSLHGGNIGFDKYVWGYDIIDSDEPALILYIESPDGDEGFPGKLSLKLTYTITKENSIVMEYDAISDKDTIFNPTNHSYFNLDGHASGTVYKQKLWIDSSFYTPNTDECLPYGEVWKTSGTPFDFTTMKEIGSDINSDYEQTKMFDGYDHNFILNGRGFRKCATMISSDEKITMDVFTDMPGVQLYSANVLDEGNYKDGATYGKHNAVCLETQFFPNSMAISHFPAPIIKKDERFISVTEYKFSVK